MSDCIIAMRSSTLAKKAERALSGAGITCKTVNVDPSLTRRGCGYGVSLDCFDVQSAEKVLFTKNITHGEVLGRY